MQTEYIESPAVLPTLEALDAEFGRKDEQCAGRRRRREGATMETNFRSIHREFANHPRAASPALDPMKESSLDTAIARPTLGRRVWRKLSRFLVVFCIGVATPLGWQSYGEVARAMIANSSPQLGWLAPQAVPVAPTTADGMAPAAAVSPELQQLALGLAAVRRSVDQLTNQLAAGQQQMGADIAKLQADQQEIVNKLSAAPRRTTVAPVPKPIPVAPPLTSGQAR